MQACDDSRIFIVYFNRKSRKAKLWTDFLRPGPDSSIRLTEGDGPARLVCDQIPGKLSYNGFPFDGFRGRSAAGRVNPLRFLWPIVLSLNCGKKMSAENLSLIVPTFADACRAQQGLVDKIHRTPVVSNQTINQRVGCQVFFKCENLQKTGSFKVRGAINALSQLSDRQLARGVVTHSSGNHAAALAYAAELFGTQAHIVMPENSSATKMAAVERYGGRVVLCPPTLEARERLAAEVQAQTGGVLIPPFDHPHVIAGQATCTLELLQQQPDLHGVICPIGGGGLISGCCLAARGLSDSMWIVGAEPAGADDAFRSKQAHRWIPQTNPQTIADGLRTSLGELTWPFVRDQVDEIVCVTDQEITDAGRYFMQRSKLLIEPSSAVGVAVLFQLAANGFESLHRHFPELSGNQPLKIGVILCGGNLEWNGTP